MRKSRIRQLKADFTRRVGREPVGPDTWKGYFKPSEIRRMKKAYLAWVRNGRKKAA